jgi:putative transposase
MNRSTNPYKRHRFPPAIIQYAVRLYHRCNLSLWCNKFGPLFTRRLKRRHPGFGDTFFIDEVFVTIAGRRHYLWRGVRFFRRLLRSHGTSPRKIVTDKLGSYRVAHRARVFKHWNEAVAA